MADGPRKTKMYSNCEWFKAMLMINVVYYYENTRDGTDTHR